MPLVSLITSTSSASRSIHLLFLSASPSCFWLKSASSSYSLLNSTSSFCKQDGLWYTAIGGQLDCSGSAMMYSSSPGFLNWEYVGLLASQVGSDSTAECRPASTNSQDCNPTGATCRSWECPDFFTVPGLNGRYALKWSDQVWPLIACTPMLLV